MSLQVIYDIEIMMHVHVSSVASLSSSFQIIESESAGHDQEDDGIED